MNSETLEAIKPWLNFIHPLLMFGILALTLYAGYLGYQHRQTRLATGEEKKALIKGKFLARHHQAGSVLLTTMVLGSLGGMSVTYINNGKLFFGPHLLAGSGHDGHYRHVRLHGAFYEKWQRHRSVYAHRTEHRASGFI